MMHPFAVVTGVFEPFLETWKGNVGSRIHCLEFYETDTSRGFVRGAKWSMAPSTGGPLNAAMPARAGEAVWGREHHRHVKERFGHCLSWGIFGEDLPDERNRVELDRELVDGAGLPAPKIVYTTSENSRRLLDFHVARASESLLEAGATRVDSLTSMRSAGCASSAPREWAWIRRPPSSIRGEGARRRQPLRRRRERLRHRGRREPDQHDHAASARAADRLVERRAEQVPA
jgi:hypothetical protein